jgi:hypothetical protein
MNVLKLTILAAGIIFTTVSNAEEKSATRGNIRILEKTENIRFLTENITKDYIYLYKEKVENKESLEKNPQIKKIKKKIEMLNNNLIIIAKTTRDKDTKNIIDFLAYTKNEMNDLLKKEIKKEQVFLILDYSEIMIEGVESISQNHKYSYSKEEKMIMNIKEIDFLLERLLKFYIVIDLGLNSQTNKEQLSNLIKKIDRKIDNVNRYTYPDEYIYTKRYINKSWKKNKEQLLKIDEYSIPNLLLLSIKDLKESFSKLENYHNQNQ